MARRRFSEANWRNDLWFLALCRALLACTTEDELAAFLRDIGTLSELQAWSERLEVARELARGLKYRDITQNTGASTTTVTRVARFLEDGAGGYRQVLRSFNDRGRHHGNRARGEQSAVMRRKLRA